MTKQTTSAKQPNADVAKTDLFEFRSPEELNREEKANIHVFGNKVVCNTDKRGYATPGNRSGAEIVVDATEGFIPLWAKDTTLRWRFQERNIRMFRNPEAVKTSIKTLFSDSLLTWGDAVPVKFKFAQRNDLWDFEIVVNRNDDCDANGCVLASAFFPDPGRNQLVIYPKMFTQSQQEQVETLAHEIGHVFGLRHFFANISERRWASEIFGTHSPFSIMNYGAQSQLTSNDKADLKQLYELAWSGDLTEINGTPIRFIKPFHTIRTP
jgi:hypothetical protein